MVIGAVVVNFNTAGLTERCVASLAGQRGLVAVVLVDCASAPEDRAALQRIAPPAPASLELVDAGTNAGFAGGCNLGIAKLLARDDIDAVLLINSDATLARDGTAMLHATLDPAAGIDLAGGRIVRPDGSTLDSMGIAMYASLLASNRMCAEDRHFGPTGGCALYSRRLLERLRDAHGYVFDESYFCYAEDTDLAARALLLGYRPGYVDAVVATHEGQASSGGGFNDFVLYHGIRNSLWMAVKCVPGWTLLLRLPLVLALHAAICVRHALRGKAAVVWRLYRDALRGMPAVMAKRRVVQRGRTIGAREFARYVTPRFYDRGYLRQSLGDLWTALRRGPG